MKRICSIILALVVLLMAGCASSQSDETTPGTIQPAESTQGTLLTESSMPALSVDEIYTEFLTALCAKLKNIIVDDTHLDGFSSREGMLGISELVVTGDVDMLKRMGYLIQDLNDDGIEELLIFQVDEVGSTPCQGSRILCLYTVADQEMVLVLEGNSKNRYYLLDDGTIYNECSESAAVFGFGTYCLDQGSTVLSCVEFNFVDMTEEENGKFYRNQSGLFDVAASELLDIDKDAYGVTQYGCVSRIQTIEITSFDAFGA